MKITQLAAAAMLACATAAGAAQAADAAPGFAGKNEWLFYNYELSGPKDAATVATSVDLLARFNKVLAANGVVLGVTMVPIKMRVYAEHLPDSVKLSDDLRGNYARIAQSMRAAQLRVIDLNTAFTTSPERTGESPLYFRLDTHWAPAGALLAGTTIKAGIDADPVLKAALDQAPVEAFKLVVGKRKINSKSRDLVEQLPKPAPAFGPEPTFAFDVTRASPAKEDLLGNRLAPPVTLVGSSYSHAWTGFPNALRHALQRDVLSVSVGADQGSWVGMESYLRDDAFQGSPPKLLIWEMPERDMRAPPNYAFRDARYLSDNTEWLLRASAWVQKTCKPSAITAKMGAMPAGATGDADFIDISFDKPVGQLDYLSMQAVVSGSKVVTLEASGPGVATRKFNVTVAGDDTAHALKSPLPSGGAGYNRVKLYPGKASKVGLTGLQVCRQPEDLLK